MEATLEQKQKQKLSNMENNPLSMSLHTFNREIEKLQNSEKPAIDERGAAHLENTRRLAVHAENNKKCYYRGKAEINEMSNDIQRMLKVKEELELEKQELECQISDYIGFMYSLGHLPK